MEENARKVAHIADDFLNLSKARRIQRIVGPDQRADMLAKRQKDAIDLQNGVGASNNEDSSSSAEDGYASSAILLGSSIAVKNAVRPIKLVDANKVPRFTTWIFLERFVKDFV